MSSARRGTSRLPLRGPDLAVAGVAAIAVVGTYVAIPSRNPFPQIHAQWLLSYDQGFIKRGLLGTVLRATVLRGDGRISPTTMLAISTTVAVIALALALSLALRTWRARRDAWIDGGPADRVGFASFLVAFATIVATPIGTLYYVSESGYHEVVNVAILLAFANLALGRPRAAVLAAAAVGASIVSCLVHENALLTTVPAMLVLWWIFSGAVGRKALVLPAVVLAACTVIVVVAATSTDRSTAAVGTVLERYPLDQADVVETESLLTRSVKDNVEFTFDKYKSVAGGGSRVLLSLVVTAPAMAFLALRVRRRLPTDRARIALAASFLPLALVFLGDDVYRWYVLVVISLAVVLIALERHPDLVPATGPAAGEGAGEAADEATEGEALWLLATGAVVLLVATVLPFPYFLDNSGNPMSEAFMRIYNRLIP